MRTDLTSAPPAPDMSSVGRAMAEHSPLPLATVEGASHIVRYVNRAFCLLLDKPMDELIGKPFAEMMQERDEFLTLLNEVYQTKKSVSHWKQRHFQPHPAFWSFSMWPVLTGEIPHGVIIQVTETPHSNEHLVSVNEALTLGSLRQHELAEAAENLSAKLQTEIIERHRVERELRANVWRLDFATTSARLTYVVVDHVSGTALTPDNFATVMGYTPPSEQENDVSAGNRVLLEHVVLEDRAKVKAALQEFQLGSLNGRVEYRVLGDDKIERWIETRWSIELDADGKPLKSFATNLDITEQKHSAEALLLSETRFHVLFDRGPIAMYSCDAAGANREFNHVAMDLWGLNSKGGKTAEQANGTFKTFLADGTPLPNTETPMSNVLHGVLPEVRDMEMVIERPDGSRINVIANIVPLKNERGVITGAINCFYDITERSRLERYAQEQAEALADLHRRKDEFLAMLSHELRNPLAPISNAVHLLRLQKNADPIQDRARGIIERQVRQMTRLIDDLMEVSRISTGRIHLQEERLSLNGVVENAVETVRPLIEKHRHSLELTLSAQPIWLYADASRLEQVFVNLLTNAAKYTEPGGSIWVTVQQEGNEAVLRVRDSGVGIAPDLIPHIFELFTQAERSLARSEGGLGIGLCLVKRLVEMHGGNVNVSSTPGVGSEFVVRLPLMATPQPSSSQRNDASTVACSLRVLIVEDNIDAAETMTLVLEASGHDVRTAHDGATGLKLALDFRPNVVLLDIGLPGMDGFEVAKRLRQQTHLGSVVLVAMTGYGEASARQLSLEAGFDHHLVKPADFKKLQDILAGVAAESPA